MKSITEKICRILSEYADVNQDQIRQEDELNTIGIDSLSMVEIIFDIEENFDLTVPELSELENRKLSLTTVADVVALVGILEEERANQK